MYFRHLNGYIIRTDDKNGILEKVVKMEFKQFKALVYINKGRMKVFMSLIINEAIEKAHKYYKKETTKTKYRKII